VTTSGKKILFTIGDNLSRHLDHIVEQTRLRLHLPPLIAEDDRELHEYIAMLRRVSNERIARTLVQDQDAAQN